MGPSEARPGGSSQCSLPGLGAAGKGMVGGGEHQDPTPSAVLVNITVQLLQSHLPQFPRSSQEALVPESLSQSPVVT